MFERVRDLNSKISAREESFNIDETLSSIVDYASNNSHLCNNEKLQKNPRDIAHHAFLECIMFQGSKSFSHLLTVIERYLPLLQKWNDSSETRFITTKLTYNFWKSNPQFLEIILGILMKLS